MKLSTGSTIGIIGGGQLGRMLAIAAAKLGYEIVVLEPQPNCPAAQVANRQITAAYDDAQALAELAAACSVVTYEFENVPVSSVDLIAAKIPVYPPRKALETAQDRIVEKDFLNGIGVTTARYHRVDNDAELAAALEAFGGRGVLKTRRFGYDGKGQRVFAGGPISTDGIHAEFGAVPLILESFVSFEREISIIAARDTDGAIVAYDPAENVHRDGILRSSTVPARIADNAEQTAVDASFEILRALDYVGVIGVEFFVMADETLVANEIAPRVHNSGHWTEAACAVSQFEQHIRAIAGLPLGDTQRHSDCVMENLIGDDIARIPDLLGEGDLVLQLYGKAESRPGRKMGHFTRIHARR